MGRDGKVSTAELAGSKPQGIKRTLFDKSGDAGFPGEFITASREFEDALARCVIRTDAQRNNIVMLKNQFDMFNQVTKDYPNGTMYDEIRELTNFLNASASVGGYGRIQALSAHVGLVFPEVLGVKVSKDSMKYMTEQVKAKRREEKEEKEEND